jgi:hypothetical protein
MIMADVKIRIFKHGKTQPDTTITIPGRVLEIANKLIPKKATKVLHDKGINVDELIKLSQNSEINGTIVDIEDHNKNEKIVISLEQHT